MNQLLQDVILHKDARTAESLQVAAAESAEGYLPWSSES